jgi:hypothetical protein
MKKCPECLEPYMTKAEEKRGGICSLCEEQFEQDQAMHDEEYRQMLEYMDEEIYNA